MNLLLLFILYYMAVTNKKLLYYVSNIQSSVSFVVIIPTVKLCKMKIK